MSALSNLVASLDCSKPQIVELFTDEYCERLFRHIDDNCLNAVKVLVEDYVKSKLGENIINYRVYSYKTLEGITAEILIQPDNTSTIIQYLLKLTKSGISLVRIR